MRRVLAGILFLAIGRANAVAEGPRKAKSGRGSRDLRVVWRSQLPYANMAPYLAASGGAVYVSTGPALSVLDASSGHVLGVFRNEMGDHLSSPTVVRPDLAIVVSKTAAYAVDTSGKPVWTYPFGGMLATSEFVQNQHATMKRDGSILLTASDGTLHAVDAVGKGLWKTMLGTYSAGSPAIPVAVLQHAALFDMRPTGVEPPKLVGVNIDGAKGGTRFSVRPGKDIASAVADHRVGVVITTYLETESRRGRTAIVALDSDGKTRWSMETGRHETVRAVTRSGVLITTSQDADASDPGSLLESWTVMGKELKKTYVDLDIRSVVLGGDGSIYVVGCKGRGASAFVQRFDGNLVGVGSRLELAEGCPRAALINDKGWLFVAGLSAEAKSAKPHAIDIAAIKTPSKSGPRGIWGMPRANSEGSSTVEFD